jgi:hypothetical protein
MINKGLMFLLIMLLITLCKTTFSQINYAVELNYSIIGGLNKDYYDNDWPSNTSIIYKSNYSINTGFTISKNISKRFYLKTGLILNPQRFTIIKDINNRSHHSPGYYIEESHEQIFDIYINIPYVLGFQCKKTSYELGFFSYHRLFGVSDKLGWSEAYDGNPSAYEPTYEYWDNKTYLKSFSKNNLGMSYLVKFNIWDNLKIQLRYKHHFNLYKTEYDDILRTSPYRQFDFGLVYYIPNTNKG